MRITRLLALLLILCFLHANAQETNWKVGVQLWTFHEFSFEKSLERLDSTGLSYMEIYPGQRIWEGADDAMGPGLSADKIDRLKNLIQQHRLRITSFGVVICEKPEEWEPNFQFAKALGIPVITAEPLERDLELVDKLAAHYQIRVAIHNHPQPSLYWHPDSVLKVIKAYPRYGACVDVGHWVRCGLDVMSSLQKLKGYILGFHFKDVTPDKSNQVPPTFNDTILGRGLCDIPNVLSTLQRQGFKGYFAIEHEANWQNNVPDIIENKKYIQRFSITDKKQ